MSADIPAQLALVAQPTSELQQTILNGVRQFNRVLVGHMPTGQDLAVAIEDADGGAVGGLWGRTAAGWLAIDLVFVPEPLRGAGLATRIMEIAEEEARRRGCHSAWLDTLNPDALRLYRRLGYTSFGELADYPTGFTRYFLHKKLIP